MPEGERRVQLGRKVGSVTRVLVLAAILEALTGLALLLNPSLVGHFLLGAEITGLAVPVAGVAGIALIALGIACWPGPPRTGMLVYSTVVALYLAYLGAGQGLVGPALWPAVGLHAVLSIVLLFRLGQTAD